MANVQWKEERGKGVTLAEKVRLLEKKQKLSERAEVTSEKTKEFKYPFKWKWKFNQTHKKDKRDMMLVIFLNKKNQIEVPKFMPIFDGNMIVYKNKPYEFDPRAVWRILGVKKFSQVYLIKETDRRPVRNKAGVKYYRDASVSNMDLDEIRSRGDSTESDEFLIKAALKAQTTQNKKAITTGVIIILGIIVVGALIYLFGGGGGT